MFSTNIFARGGHARYHGPTHKNYSSTVRAKGYTKKNGIYVAPHYKTSPDKSKTDNWSTKGNVNPMTGKKGTADPNGIDSRKHKKLHK